MLRADLFLRFFASSIGVTVNHDLRALPTHGEFRTLMTTSVGNNLVFRSFFEKQKLTGPNFIDWYRKLCLVLSTKDKEIYLEHPIPAAPVAPPGQQIVREFHTCKQEEGQSVSSYVLNMKGYINNLERLGQPFGQNIAVSLILVSLNKDFDSFVQNYNMHGMGKTVNELHAMLKLHEDTLPKKDDNLALHAIRAGRVQKNQKNKPHKAAKEGHSKGKGKIGYAPNNVPFAPKPKTPPPPKKDNPAKDTICHQCGPTGKHISKKRIEKLQQDGLINSIDIELLGKYVSCLSGKMARKPYSHQVERAKDLLGLIHTDVCGPFRIVSRQGASYFITFTDDFSHYGYVYLLKHKHEVFETFKVFQKEVENQLGKTIKSLCSNRGGEYMSQEFLDHLKEHGIIAHRTPPYTPQNNGVSKKRNQTLLDMVRSMMSQTTLPKSFWDYALEIVARILNMVPTKKVEKTPYEIWHGQAPKLSY
ncbi:retrotransposon protein, putative, ty1-copia subclass [Tanacetum coccineum]